MKNAILFIKDKENIPFNELKEIESLFLPSGIVFDHLEVLPVDDDLAFKRQVSTLKQTMDNLFVFVPKSVEFDFKSIIAEETERELFENDGALSFISTYVEKFGGEIEKDYAYLPVDATVVPNVKGLFQGFMIEDSEFTMVVLPTEKEEFSDMCSSFVIPYFENKYDKRFERFTFKYFGSEKTLISVLNDISLKFENAFTFHTDYTHGDVKAEILFVEGKEYLKNDVLREVVGVLKENVYAEFDTTLSQRLFDALSIKNVKISVAESFTAGRVISSIIKNSGASKYVHEGIVSYSNEAKEKRLMVKKGDLISVGAVSPEVAYQMAKGLLIDGGCDLAISTTGIAGPKSDDTAKPVGLCYIGVGTREGIHVYKYNFSGDRETITETAKNTALFLAIKKLKNLR